MTSPRSPAGDVRDWCAHHSHQGEPEPLMVRLCQELVAFDDSPPVDLEVLQSVRGVDRFDVVDMAQAGCIYVDGGRYRIRLRASDSHRRRRFTWAHEICHTFFDATHKRSVVDNEVGRHSASDPIEHLCDVGAAELLLPRHAFEQRCPNAPGFDDVAALAAVFEASLEATANRIVGLALGPRQLVVLEPGLTVGQERALARASLQPAFAGFEAPSPEPRLRVVWSAGDRFVPRNKSVNDGAALLRCLDGADIDSVEDPGFTDGEIVRVVARHLPYFRDGVRIERVMAFVYDR